MRSIILKSACSVRVNRATARVTLQGDCVNNKILFRNTFQSYGIIFSEKTDTTITISFTKGGGERSLVVVRLGDIPVPPVDGSAYTANTVFGSGSDLGSSSYVVYKGSGSSVNVTGLTHSVQYYFQVFNYTDDTTLNYNIATASNNPLSTYMLPVLPTIQAHSINHNPPFGGPNGSSEIGYTAGNGEYKLVVAKEGSPVDVFPVDGIFNYNAGDPTFGTGSDLGGGNYVISINSDTVQEGDPVAPFSLNQVPSIPIHVRVFEFNIDTGPGYARYLTTTDTGNPAALN